ncbi:SMC family ATPase, partial [Rothia mucilaginosa]|uniref:SMC family ATPase n=1 Tax=Rothia mucilaginosa TaxID=43675 RepID=UPI0026EC4BF5
MILHRLEFEAFMAYPDRQTIDFSDLNAAGVFLLNGPTGAGKTTILDAICYALYGGTTGDRDPAQLYSTYVARANTQPRVFLDLTLQGRRLRINRTPVYSHPITRGKRAGQMTVKAATATVEELLPGGNPEDEQAWKPIASQVKEVNAVIAERIHLNREQFLKVVLLAQGQFAQFLKSKPVERKELLKKMFPVEHIEAMYAELLEEAKQARQDVANDEQALENYLDRARSGMEALHESLAPLTPEAGEESAADGASETATTAEAAETITAETVAAETLDAWLAAGIEEARTASARDALEQSRLAGEADRHTQTLNERLQLRKDWSEYEQLIARRERLVEGQEPYKARVKELADARAAAPLVAHYTQMRGEEEDIEERRAQQAEYAGALKTASEDLLRALRAGEEPAEDAVPYPEEELFAKLAADESAEARGQQLDGTLASLRALHKRDDLLAQEERTVRQARARSEQLMQKAESAAQNLDALGARVRDIQENLSAYEKAEEEHALALRGAEDAEKAHREAQQAQQNIDAAQRAVTEAEKESERTLKTQQKAQERWQKAARASIEATDAFRNLQAQRLAQASSLLARELTEGEPCPVCGSAEHPSPARARDGERLVEQADLDAAKAREDRAHEACRAREEEKEKAALAHHQASEALASARSQSETLTSQERMDPEQSARQLTQARERVQQTTARLAERDALRKRQAQAEVEQKTAEETRSTLHDTLTEAQALYRESLERRDALARELEPAKARIPFAQRIEALESYRALAQREEQGSLLLNRAVEEHSKHLVEVQVLLRESPFADSAGVMAAERTKAQILALEEAVNAYELESARVGESLGREALVEVAARVAAGEQAPDDQQELKDRIEELRQQVQHLTRREGEREGIVRSLRALHSEFIAFRERTAERYDRAEMLSALAAAARGDTLGGYTHQV